MLDTFEAVQASSYAGTIDSFSGLIGTFSMQDWYTYTQYKVICNFDVLSFEMRHNTRRHCLSLTQNSHTHPIIVPFTSTYLSADIAESVLVHTS